MYFNNFYSRIYGDDLGPLKCIHAAPPLLASVAVRSQAVVLLLLIHCLLLLLLYVGVLCLVLVLLCSTWYPSSLAEEERAG